MFQNIIKRSQCLTKAKYVKISPRFYSSNNTSSNYIASQQRKKILTYQKAKFIDDKVNNINSDKNAQENIIHPAFVTSSNLSEYLGKPVKPVVSVTKCESYDLNIVRNDLSLKGIAPIQIVPNECITFKYKEKDVFIFKFGTIVAWDIVENEILNNIVSLIRNAEIDSYNYQSEDLDYIEISNLDFKANDQIKSMESFVAKENEIICLNTTSSQQKILDMLAFSYGISRSTRLAILEEAVEKHIKLSKETINKLSHGEKIAVNSKDTLKLSGRLLLLRGKLNLYSELVETPDIYWSESRLEKIHENISNSLDISKRINILNRKLDYLSDEAEALISIMSKRTEVNLELIIIYLIVIEVCFEIYHFYDRLGGTYNIEYFRALFTGKSIATTTTTN